MKWKLDSKKALGLAVWVVYALAFATLYCLGGVKAGVLAALPVVVTAWLTGMWPGMLSGLLAFLFSTLFVTLAAEADWNVMIRDLWGAGSLVLIGGVAGYLHDLDRRVRKEGDGYAWAEMPHSRYLVVALSEAAQVVAHARTADEVYRAVGAEMAGLGYQVVLFRLTNGRTSLALSYMTLKPAPLQAAERLAGVSAQGFCFAITPGGIHDRVISGGRAVFFEDIVEPLAEVLPGTSRPLLKRAVTASGLKEAIYAPLRIEDKRLGLLVVVGARLTESETLAVTAFANQVAIALENAELHEETDAREAELRRRVQELSALNAVAAIANESLTVDKVLGRAVDEALSLVDVEAAAVWLLDGETNELVMAAHRGLSDDLVQAFRRLEQGESPSWQAVQTGGPVVIDDLAEYSETWSALVERERVRSAAVVPLVGHTGAIGTVSLAADDPHRFDTAGLELLVSLGRQIATAVEKARLYEREAERAADLERLKTFNESIVEGVAEAILIEDAEGILTFANRAAEGLLGYSRGELTGRHWSTIVPEHRQVTVRRELAKRPGGVASRYETALLSKEGQAIPVIVSARPLFEEERFAGVLSVITDITEQKQTEKVLRATLDQLWQRTRETEALLEGSRAILAHKVFRDASQAIFDSYRALVEATMGCVILLAENEGESEVLLLGLEDRPRVADPSFLESIHKLFGGTCRINEVVYDNDVASSGWRVTLPEGHIDVENGLFAPLMLEGNTVGLIGLANKPGGFTRDDARVALAFGELASIALLNSRSLESLRQTQEELRKYTERLEEMVQERTRALEAAQVRLVRRERLAVLGQLASSVGHELRNPLGAIRNTVYLLRMILEEPEPGIEEALVILDKEVDTSRQIIDSLLDFARVRTPARRQVEIHDILLEVLASISVPENIEVICQLDETLPALLADTNQLLRVFGNILVNAIQAMPEGGQLVVRSQADDSSWVSVSVTDSGVGIPKENLDAIFEPLFTTKAAGIGLGLSLAKMLVEGHGGTVEVQSVEDKGSTFTVRLPVVDVPSVQLVA